MADPDSLPPPERTPWEKKSAQDDRRRDQRSKNERLFAAVQTALKPEGSTERSAEKRLDAIRRAIADGADVNARATLVQFDKARPVSMVALNLASPHAIEVLNVLLEQGADLHVRDRNGNTATHEMIGRLWGHRINATSLDNLQQWCELGGAQDLSHQNRDGNTPLALVLRENYMEPTVTVEHHPQRVVDALIAAGARVEDLPGNLLHELLDTNRRPAFDLAVRLGMDVQGYQQAGNLWSVWAQRFLNRHSGAYDESFRHAWMERLIELGVNPHAAHRPDLAGHSSSDVAPSSALVVALRASLNLFRLDETCLTRLKDLGCAAQTPTVSPLHEYAAQAKVEHLGTLHSLGFDLAGARNALGETLLQIACSASLRGIWSYKGEVRTIQDTVRVLLGAGCDPNVRSTHPKSKLAHPLSESVTNEQSFQDTFDRAETVERLIAAGANLEADGSSALLIGKLLYPHAFSTQMPRLNDPAYRWQAVSVDPLRLATVDVLLQNGAHVPHTVVPGGMPVMMGMIPSPGSDHRFYHLCQPLYAPMLANEDAGWAERFAHQALAWLGKGLNTTNVQHEQAASMVSWMVEHGVPASALGDAARALNYQADHPLTRHVEQLELRAEMRAAMPADLPTAMPRARL